MTRFSSRVWFLWLLLWATQTALAINIKDVYYSRLPDKAQIVVVAGGKVEFEKLDLNNPPRLVIDIKNGRFQGKKSFQVNEGAITQVRSGYFQNTNFRVVIDLNKPVRNKVYKQVNKLDGNEQVIIDIFDDYKTVSIAPPPTVIDAKTRQSGNLQLESLSENKQNSLTVSPPSFTVGRQKPFFDETNKPITEGYKPSFAHAANSLPEMKKPLFSEPSKPQPEVRRPLFHASNQPQPEVKKPLFADTRPSLPQAKQPLFQPQRPTSSSKQVIRHTTKRKTTKMPLRPTRDIVIAIDPGHGGKDPGARNRSMGLLEKDVVLQIGKRLKQKIDARPGFRAIMTRDRDIFIPLQQRAKIARRHNADLFVSIHADAVNSIEPSGSSVYILSTRGATSQLAKYLENSENSVDLRWGVDVSKYDDDIQEALLTIQQEATLESSFSLAEKTLNELKSLGKVHKRNVERANFVVLRSPEIPSMLVETAFISNPDEARKLASPSYQDRLAEGIANGIFRYFEDHLPQHRLLGQ